MACGILGLNCQGCAVCERVLLVRTSRDRLVSASLGIDVMCEGYSPKGWEPTHSLRVQRTQE